MSGSRRVSAVEILVVLVDVLVRVQNGATAVIRGVVEVRLSDL